MADSVVNELIFLSVQSTLSSVNLDEMQFGQQKCQWNFFISAELGLFLFSFVLSQINDKNWQYKIRL